MLKHCSCLLLCRFTILYLISAIVCLLVSIVGVRGMAVKKQCEVIEKSKEISWKYMVFSIPILLLSLGCISWTVPSHHLKNTTKWNMSDPVGPMPCNIVANDILKTA